MKQFYKHYKHIKPILEDLRIVFVKIFIAFCVVFLLTYVNFPKIYPSFVKPIELLGNGVLIYSGIFDMIIFQIKFAFFCTILVIMPLCSYWVIVFVNKSLYPHEQKVLLRSMILLNLIIYFSVACVRLLLLPYVMVYMNRNYATFTPYITAFNYLNIFIFLSFAICVLSAIPILLLFFLKRGVISIQQMQKFRKHFIVCIFVLTGFLAPPDALSQVIMSAVIICLYEMIIIFAPRLGVRNKAKRRKFRRKKKRKSSHLLPAK